MFEHEIQPGDTITVFVWNSEASLKGEDEWVQSGEPYVATESYILVDSPKEIYQVEKVRICPTN